MPQNEHCCCCCCAEAAGRNSRSNAQSSGLEGATGDLGGLRVRARSHFGVLGLFAKFVGRRVVKFGDGLEEQKIKGTTWEGLWWSELRRQTAHAQLALKPLRGGSWPGLVTLTDCRPTFCFHTIYPILGRPQHIDDLTFPRTKSFNLTIRKDGSPSRSPCRYAICLLAEFPREGYDQALDLPQAVQVRFPALDLTQLRARH